MLRISNRTRFARDNPNETMENIFNAISNIYPHGSKISSIDVLLPANGDNSPDTLIDFFYVFASIKKAFANKHYAEVIQLLENQRFVSLDGRKKGVFHPSMKVTEHDDKKRLQTILKKAFGEYSDNSEYKLNSFLVYLTEQKIIVDDFVEHIQNIEDDNGKAIYVQLLSIELNEMKRLIDYKENQSISTQHGVKGEGHPKVCFWSENSKRNIPYVYMYDFFRMFTQLEEFKLESFQEFYYEFKTCVCTLEEKLRIRINRMNSSYITKENICLFDEIINKFEGNVYFENIFQEAIRSYKEKRKEKKLPTLKSIQVIFKPDTVNRILVSYKLFYVGCSRAKDELVVLINQEEISSFEIDFKDKMSGVGFEMISKA